MAVEKVCIELNSFHLRLFFLSEFPAKDGADLHVCVLPGAGLPANHYCLLTQCLQGSF